MLKDRITHVDRILGQRYAILANSTTIITNSIVLSAFMVIYATDVLGFSAKRIASILALVPLTAVLRVPLVSFFKKYPKTLIMKAGDLSCIAAVIIIMAIPASYMSFYLFVVVVFLYCFSHRIGVMTLWQPLLKDITTDNDRGSFFGRMRLVMQLVSVSVIAVISYFVGASITEVQYKLLLLFIILSHLNHIYWVGKIPESFEYYDNEQTKGLIKSLNKFFDIIKKSPAMRMPLLVAMLGVPIFLASYIIYIKKVLNVPSNITSIYVLLAGIGAGVGLMFWGKITDTIGFKPVKIGIRIIFVIFVFLNLFISPFSADISSWQDMTRVETFSFVIICVFGLIQGLVVSCLNLSWTSLMHFNIDSKNSIEEITAFTTFFNIAWAIEVFIAGLVIDEFAVPAGVWQVANGLCYLDYYKLYLFLIIVPLQIICIYFITKIKDTRPYFGVFDFFSSLTPLSMRTMVFQRNIYNQDEDKRMETAYRLGSNITPMGIDPMTELLSDTSYDVKLCAIMGLARSKSDLAGEKLLDILNDEERLQLADHASWALGELRYVPAFDSLLKKLDPKYSSRIRAMAARALGKLSDPRAIPYLVEILENKGGSERPHLLSSACKALLRLKDIEHSGLYFKTLLLLQDREDRCEIADALCPMLDIPNGWLIKYTSEAKISAPLLHFCSLKSSKWQEYRKEITNAIRNSDLGLIIDRVCSEADKEPYKSNYAVKAMADVLAGTEKWNAVSAIAGAWLLLKDKD